MHVIKPKIIYVNLLYHGLNNIIIGKQIDNLIVYMIIIIIKNYKKIKLIKLKLIYKKY